MTFLHGTRQRARKRPAGGQPCSGNYCRRFRSNTPIGTSETELWPISRLTNIIGEEVVVDALGEERYAHYCETGLDDYEADFFAVKLARITPIEVWPGWIEAGLDDFDDQ